MRQLHPNGLRPMMVNREETAGDLIRHLHNQIAASPSDERAKGLLAEVLAYPGVPAQWRTREIGTPRIESSFPADETTATACRELIAS